MSNHRFAVFTLPSLFAVSVLLSAVDSLAAQSKATPAKATPANANGGGAKPRARAPKPLTPVQKALAASIAVVDMEAAAAHTKAYKQGQKDLTALSREFKSKLEALKTEIDTVRMELDILRTGTMKQVEAMLKHDALVGKRKLASEMYRNEISRRRAENDNNIYVELTKAVGELAAERGIILVLRKRPALSVEEMLAKELVRSANEGMSRQIENNKRRSVIYHKKELDLTEDLIKYLKE